ncbi:hypothetical protein AYM02_03735 [Coxiella burnetii]|uniref:CBU_1639 family Dot/Icm T4SS effector n=1 Tax=Coxiella burnetii TaxID=777 RepID=UPI0003A32F58|nr:CBU_1639 family Dot/Icm T4SS effector [Coxiella burnetii]AML48463.1 hypothetical protein AUR58_04175 [Coxiella burnetii]AML54465.1 hypothetical protein AYM38_03690 [Coxiella burnetii]ATN68427.1 hypothetical protein AYM00_03865 [Coxiella burnetii]ATN70356.1 hypothetical protein AYM02_03735 [Coxiella burnetii]ATN72293.1 hypothetical protein AYM11_03600 [Coxiella burnetii]
MMSQVPFIDEPKPFLYDDEFKFLFLPVEEQGKFIKLTIWLSPPQSPSLSDERLEREMQTLLKIVTQKLPEQVCMRSKIPFKRHEDVTVMIRSLGSDPRRRGYLISAIFEAKHGVAKTQLGRKIFFGLKGTIFRHYKRRLHRYLIGELGNTLGIEFNGSPYGVISFEEGAQVLQKAICFLTHCSPEQAPLPLRADEQGINNQLRGLRFLGDGVLNWQATVLRRAIKNVKEKIIQNRIRDLAQAMKVAFNLTDDDDFNRWVIVQRAFLVIREERIEAEWENTGKAVWENFKKSGSFNAQNALRSALKVLLRLTGEDISKPNWEFLVLEKTIKIINPDFQIDRVESKPEESAETGTEEKVDQEKYQGGIFGVSLNRKRKLATEESEYSCPSSHSSSRRVSR